MIMMFAYSGMSPKQSNRAPQPNSPVGHVLQAVSPDSVDCAASSNNSRRSHSVPLQCSSQTPLTLHYITFSKFTKFSPRVPHPTSRQYGPSQPIWKSAHPPSAPNSQISPPEPAEPTTNLRAVCIATGLYPLTRNDAVNQPRSGRSL